MVLVLRLKVTERELIDFEKTDDKKPEVAKPSFESSKASKDVETITVPLMAECRSNKKYC